MALGLGIASLVISALGSGAAVANQTRQRKVAKKQNKEQKKLLMEQEMTEQKRERDYDP